MDILIPNNWLREFLKTDATNGEIAKYLSLSGPSVEKIIKNSFSEVYSIEVTTNRMDTASVYGIAREASAILPRFGKKAKLASIKLTNNFTFSNKVDYLSAQVDPKLCPRFTSVLIKNVKFGKSSQVVRERLSACGIRPINNIVDISNYIMLELGQPVHTFDYDKIKGSSMVLRESKKGEKITTLDDKEFILPGGDIVIEDGKGRLIDLCGIMGGSLSAIDEYTQNVLLFIQNYDPVHIRKTSMTLAQRSMAASLFEKGIDPELIETAILKATKMFEELTGGIPEKEVLDIYPNPIKEKAVSLDFEKITKKLGIEISRKDITEILTLLGFSPSWIKNQLKVSVPSFRSDDVIIPEDVVEEIARIYGYHNFPSRIMSGVIPDKPADSPFDFEEIIKNLLKGYGGAEVYTFSLVSKANTDKDSLKLANPLGTDSEYLRTSLMHSLSEAVKQNASEKEAFHLFEIANVYIPKNGKLPDEKMTLAGMFANTDYRQAKGVIEALLEELNIKAVLVQEELKGFLPGQRIEIKVGDKVIGQFGNLEEGNYTYYEFGIAEMKSYSDSHKKYVPIPSNPPQIEDLTFNFPVKTKIGDVINLISSKDKTIEKVELKDIFNDAYTFRIWYQDKNRTLTNKEVESVRKEIVKTVKAKFGGTYKD